MKHLLILSLAILLSLNTLATNIQHPEVETWCDSVYNSLTTRQKIGQLFTPRIEAQDSAKEWSALKSYINDYNVGGIMLGKGDVTGAAKLTKYAQEISDVPLLISIDGEWGLVMRLHDAPRFPINMTIGATNNDSLTYAYGFEMAQECKRIGLNINFAPDIDVNSNANNPVIARRAFGDDPEMVSRLGIAYAKGLNDGGVISVAKHFPGHGDVDVDSHYALPVNNKSREELENEELYPFKRYINEGLNGVMVAHLVMPALDSITGLPASLSPLVIDTLLRGEMGYKGLVFTDALDMRGASNNTQAVMALMAGSDVLLMPSDFKGSFKQIEDGIASGEIPESRLKSAVMNILRAKYPYRNVKSNLHSTTDVVKGVNTDSAKGLINLMYSKSVTLLKNNNAILPLKNIDKKRVNVSTFGANSTASFRGAINKYVGSANGDEKIEIVGVYGSSNEVISQVTAQCKGKKYILSFFISPYMLPKFKSLINGAEAVILAYEMSAVPQKYAAEVIFGGVGARGRLPINIDPIYKRGDGLETKVSKLSVATPESVGMCSVKLAAIDTIIDEAIQKEAFPGCRVLVARSGKIVFDKSYGTLDGVNEVKNSSIYDLASITKCAATLPLLMHMVDRGMIDIDSTYSHYLPELKGSELEGITIREALHHESGLPSSISKYKFLLDTTTCPTPIFSKKMDEEHDILVDKNCYASSEAKLRTDLFSETPSDSHTLTVVDGLYANIAVKDSVFERIKGETMLPKKYRYSDLSFILLQHIIERSFGSTIDVIADSILYKPMGLTNLCYNPLKRYKASDIAPSEVDLLLRKDTLRGYTHDELCGFMGGISGNAGLFGDAEDVAALFQMYLNGGEYAGVRLLSSDVIDMFAHTISTKSRRALGFDRPDLENQKINSISHLASPETFGHTGYTGVAAWCDPSEELVFVFLTNRTYPSRANKGIFTLDIRPRISTSIYTGVK